MRRFMLIVISYIFIFGVFNCSRKSESENSPEGEKFRSVSLINLNTDEDEAEFLKILNSYKIVFEDIGYPNSMYRIWKERDKEGKYKYIIEANWPNYEAYEKFSNSEKFKEIHKKLGPRFDELVKEFVYNRYIRLN